MPYFISPTFDIVCLQVFAYGVLFAFSSQTIAQRNLVVRTYVYMYITQRVSNII